MCISKVQSHVIILTMQPLLWDKYIQIRCPTKGSGICSWNWDEAKTATLALFGNCIMSLFKLLFNPAHSP